MGYENAPAMHRYTFPHKLLFILLFTAVYQQPLRAQLGLSSSRSYFLGSDRAQVKGTRSFQTEVFYSFSFPGIKGDTVPKDHFKLAPAFQWTAVHFDADRTVSRSNGITSFETLTTPGVDFRRSNLCIGSVQMRGQLRLKNKSGDGYARYTPGLYAGYAVLGRFKRNFRQDGSEEKVRTPLRDDPDFFGLNRFQAGHFGTFTHGMLSLWYGVSFTPFFELGQGPLLREVRFGAIIVLPVYFGDIQPLRISI